MAESNLTAERLRELLSYDKDTGLFTWKVRRNGFVGSGSTAGTVGTGGYIHIRIDNSPYMAHRLEWFYETNSWPKSKIDHINGLTSDNRISNLRECSHSENMQNTKTYKNNTTGLKGVYHCKRSGKFTSIITVDGVQNYLGAFESKELAHAAYTEAKAKLHKFQPTVQNR